ncbi:CpaF family protein [Actinobaculum suis]|uniref:CpaF family protein n=1 Tax=Actinobaculum suis TaxID=1657 RepID=UPI000AF1B904
MQKAQAPGLKGTPPPAREKVARYAGPGGRGDAAPAAPHRTGPAGQMSDSTREKRSRTWQTESRAQKTESRAQKTESRAQKTESRAQKTESRAQKTPSTADAQVQIEAKVRGYVRERGLDPNRQPALFDRLIGEAISAYEEETTRSGGARLAEPAQVHAQVRAAIGGYGPLQPLFDDPEVEEIWIDTPSTVFVSRGGRAELTNIVLTDSQVTDLVERMLRASGRRVDYSSPFVDAQLAGGERLHVVIPDITREHWAVNIRKYVVRARHLRDLVAKKSLTGQAANFLEAAIKSGLNVIVSGTTGAGKTTFLRALLGATDAGERIISAEEVFELGLEHRDTVAMQTRPPSLEGRGEVTLRRLVREALRMRPGRLVIGEVRGAEAFDLLIALNSGIPGACTIHANSAREALLKLCTLPLLTGENVTSEFVVPTVAATIDVVVHLSIDRAGKREVAEILGVPGRVESGVIQAVSLFGRNRGGALRLRTSEVPRPELFQRAGYDLHQLLHQEAPHLSHQDAPSSRQWKQTGRPRRNSESVPQSGKSVVPGAARNWESPSPARNPEKQGKE